MEHIDYLIVAIFVLIIFLLYKDQNLLMMEKYTTFETEFSKADQTTINDVENNGMPTSYMPTRYMPASSKNRSSNFGNFGIIGAFPAIPICDSCGLEFGCAVYPYESDDHNETVCRKCSGSGLNKNYSDLSKPINVYARSAGKPRQCRQIIAQ